MTSPSMTRFVERASNRSKIDTGAFLQASSSASEADGGEDDGKMLRSCEEIVKACPLGCSGFSGSP